MNSFYTTTLVEGCFRYALGRRSYFVKDAIDAILAAWPHTIPISRRRILQECEDAISEGRAGDAMDVAAWSEFIVKAERMGFE